MKSPPKRSTTKIFDGSLMEPRVPKTTTFRSKRGQSHQGTRTRGIYLPKVAVAMKLHEKAQELIERRLAEADRAGCD